MSLRLTDAGCRPDVAPATATTPRSLIEAACSLHDRTALQQALRVLDRIISNVLEGASFDMERFHRIRRDSAAYKTSLGSAPDLEPLLCAAGFVLQAGGDVWIWQAKGDIDIARAREVRTEVRRTLNDIAAC